MAMNTHCGLAINEALFCGVYRSRHKAPTFVVLSNILTITGGNSREILIERIMQSKQVRDLMSPSVKTLGLNDKLSVADELMQTERIRHLPIVNEDGRVVGIVSQRDLFFNALVQALGFGSTSHDRILSSILVKEVMTENVVTTTPEALVTDAARVMVDRKIGCLPVIQNDALVGILSESDIVSAVAKGIL
jgi:CBS domain-containing membrane protein